MAALRGEGRSRMLLIKHLEYLTALAREKHFARAAAACGVTQPTLSAGVKHLEDTLGILIVERGQRFRGFTPEGQRVLAWAWRILSDRDAMFQDVSAMRVGLEGRLKLGVVPSALPVVALLTAPFAARHPRTTVAVLTLASVEIQRGLDDFSLDVGLTYLDNEPLTHVRATPLYRERYVLVTPADGPLASRTTVTWHEAADLPLCLLTPDMQNRRIVDGHFLEVGVVARPHVETNSLIAVWSHVRLGGYSSVLPHAALALLGTMPGLVALPLVAPTASHSVGLIVPDRDPLTPLAAAIMDFAHALDLSTQLDRLAPTGDPATDTVQPSPAERRD